MFWLGFVVGCFCVVVSQFILSVLFEIKGVGNFGEPLGEDDEDEKSN